jgi:hypothetical protein
MIVLPFGIIFMIRTTIPFGERLVMEGDFMEDSKGDGYFGSSRLRLWFPSKYHCRSMLFGIR